MRVLVACEFSGIVRDAFAVRGHDAWSCDLLPTEREGPHIQDDVLKHLNDGWDLMIAHPPCTYLAGAGARWWKFRQVEQEKALDFIRHLLSAPISMIALENPYGCISTRIRRPDQIIQPYQFGDSFQKTTHLWLKNLPKLTPTRIVDRGEVYPQFRNGAKWLMQMGPSKDRWKNRSRTFQGIADAMADQWGSL